jgi:hypothetical protein
MAERVHVSAKSLDGRIFGVGGENYEEFWSNLVAFMGDEDLAQQVVDTGRQWLVADPATAAAVQAAQRGLGARGQQRGPQRGRNGGQAAPGLSAVQCSHNIPARYVNSQYGPFYACGLPYKDPDACDFKQNAS